MTIEDKTYDLMDVATELDACQNRGDWVNGMRQLNRAADLIADIGALLVERGVQAGMTQKRMADLLGVSPRTLEGAKREFAR